MKKLFYLSSILFIVSIAVGLVQFDNFRDRVYLLAMLLGFVSVISGIAYLVKQK